MRFSQVFLACLMVTVAVWPVAAVNSGDDKGHAVLYTNKYVYNNPAVMEVLPPDAYGYVVFSARGCSVQDPYIFIARKDANITFDRTFHYDQTLITGQNPGTIVVKLLPDGVSETIGPLAAGTYIAYMRRGNGDQPEQYEFKIGGAQIEHVVFLGAAIPPKPVNVCKSFLVTDRPGYVIHHNEVNHTEVRIITPEVPGWTEHFGDFDAQHNFVGMGNGDYIRSGSGVVDPYLYDYIAPIEHAAVYETVCHEEVNHTETIIDTPYSPAWDEFIYHPEVNHTLHHDEIQATGRLAIWQLSRLDYEAGHVHARENGNPSQTDFWYNGHRYHITGDRHDTAFVVTPGTSAWDELVVDHEAYTETIHHDEVAEVSHTIIVVDTPAYCEEVLVSPAWTEHFGSYDADHNYVGTGNGDYTRTGDGTDDPYVFTFIPPVEHPIVPAVTETVIVVDQPEWDEPVGPATHKETVCSIYGRPVPPAGSVPIDVTTGV